MNIEKLEVGDEFFLIFNDKATWWVITSKIYEKKVGKNMARLIDAELTMFDYTKSDSLYKEKQTYSATTIANSWLGTLSVSDNGKSNMVNKNPNATPKTLFIKYIFENYISKQLKR